MFVEFHVVHVLFCSRLYSYTCPVCERFWYCEVSPVASPKDSERQRGAFFIGAVAMKAVGFSW